MSKLIKFLFGKYIEKKAQELFKERIVEKVSAHDRLVSKAHIDTKVLLATYDKTDKLTDNYGISEKREKILMDALTKGVKDCSTFAEAIEQVSTVCIHPNELAFSSFMMGTYAGKQSSGMGSGILGLLGLLDMFKRGQNGKSDDE